MTTPARSLDLIVKENWFKAQATIASGRGQWAMGRRHPVYADDSRKTEDRDVHTLRQQLANAEGRFNAALSDSSRLMLRVVPDYIGAFVVTRGDRRGYHRRSLQERQRRLFLDICARRWRIVWRSIRRADASARVRKEFWGPTRRTRRFRPINSSLKNTKGNPPRARLSAQPDHTEKATLLVWLRCAEHRRVKLTENYAMWPGSSGVGALFQPSRKLLFRRRQDRARPARGLCRAQRLERGGSERWLAPVLNYIPAQDQSAPGSPVKEAMPTLAPGVHCPRQTMPHPMNWQRIRRVHLRRASLPIARRRQSGGG